jgi:ubiquitin-protein ligase
MAQPIRNLPNPALTRRLPLQLQKLKQSDFKIISIQQDLSHIIIELTGPRDSLYPGIKFLISIHIPERYPFEAPIIQFLTPIFHPMIGRDGICHLWEFDYSSINRLLTLLLTISALLYDPTLNGDLGQMCVVNRQAYDLYRTNPAQFRKQAKKLSGGIEQIKAKAYNKPQLVKDYIFRQDTQKQFHELTQQQLRQLKQQKQRKAQQEQRRVHRIRDDLNDTLLAIRRPRGP